MTMPLLTLSTGYKYYIKSKYLHNRACKFDNSSFFHDNFTRKLPEKYHWLSCFSWAMFSFHTFLIILKLEQLNFGVQYDDYTATSETPYLTGLRNRETDGLGMCMWYKLNKKPGSSGRFLFQYTRDDQPVGFSARLSNNDRLQINYGIDYLITARGYDTKVLDQWRHLCISANNSKSYSSTSTWLKWVFLNN